MTSAVQTCGVAMPNPHSRSGSLSNHVSSHQTTDKTTLAKFASNYNKEFPTNFVVCKGFYGPNEDLKFSEGDRFKAHSLKQSTVINIEYDNGQREDVPVSSNIPFAILYNPQSNTGEAIKGYKYEKVSDLVQLSVLPPVLWSRKAYQGSTPDSSVSANELLIVRCVKSRLVGKQQLKVYSLTQRKEKTLYTTCTGSFSTKPHDICLHLSDILKHMPDIFPCRAIMFNPAQIPGNVISKPMRMGACVVTMMHSSINTSIIISSALGHRFQTSQTRYLEVPIDTGIMVRRDTSMQDDVVSDKVYKDVSPYSRFDISNQQLQVSNVHNQQLLSSSNLNPEPTSNRPGQSQFYTNVHFGQETPQRKDQAQFPSVEKAVETGHYQTPSSLKERTSSDPIAIDSIYHPPDDAPPGNYVLLSKNGDRSGSAGSGSGGCVVVRGPGSWERNSPGSGSGSVDNVSPSSSSYRPPLPPPNKTRRNLRSPGYAYVDTNPNRSAQVYENEASRTQANGNGGNGAVPSTSYPESAHSLSSFGSSGSGGAVVERRFSGGQFNRLYPHPGSGDGIVERAMRTSSISSQGYSYAKSNPLSHPHPAPPSPHHYSHLRSRSGPPVIPQLPTLSAQVMQQQHRQSPKVIATTRLDNDSESIVVVQRQASVPAFGVSKGSHGSGAIISRQESAPMGLVVNEVEKEEEDSRNRPDTLSVMMDDLARIAQELDESIFQQDISSEPSPSEETHSPQVVPDPPTTSCDTPSSRGTTSVKDYPPEVIEKHRTYLRSMDLYQILNLLEIMGLEQYTPIFKQEQINGDILSTCDDALLRDELKVSSRLHRMRLLRVIEGTYSVHEIMSGKDGYIFMTSAGKQQ